MPIRKVKGTTPGRRQMTTLTYEEITTKTPFKPLLVTKKQQAGRSDGTITVRHRGGGSKRKIRLVDFKQDDKVGIPATVRTVEYDPNRTAFLMLVCYVDGEYRYHLAPEGVKVGDSIICEPKARPRLGNRLQLQNIPVGFEIYNIQVHADGGGQMVKSAGSVAKLVSLEGEYAQVQLPSGEIRFFLKTNYATIGRLSNVDQINVVIGKAGRNRHRGKRPQVRGKVMNPCDHPHGGGKDEIPLVLSTLKLLGELMLSV